ncbi:MAG: hypothetical protein RL213_1562 [Bacteroidota bacterium]|jgi:hypothetical protein
MITYKNLFTACLFLLFQAARLYAQDMTVSSYQYETERIVRNLVPERATKEIELYRAMDKLPRIVWGHVKSTKVEEFPITYDGVEDTLNLLRHGSEKYEPDEWSLGPESSEFGFHYDLNKDGRYDYIIYNGGYTMDFSYWFFHWVDDNYDGKIDRIVYPEICPPGDSIVKPGLTVWVQDTDGDSLTDHVTYVDTRNRKRTPITAVDGKWTFRAMLGEEEISREPDYFQYPNFILSILNGRGKKSGL